MSSILALAVLLHGAPLQAKPVELSRKFTLGEKLNYFARAQFTDEQRGGSLQTFMPSDEEISYRYTMEVQKVKADGIAEVLYQRPTIDIVMGDTAEAGEKRTTQKLGWKMLLDVTPVNEVVSQKDLNPPKAGKGIIRSALFLKAMKEQGQADGAALSLLSFVSEVQRMAFFVGSLDSGLDIAPKLPFEEVSVGSTWKKTVGYTPGKLKGSDGKMAVQRLDYTYTYLGVMKSKEGKDIHRIQGKVKMETDLAEFGRQLAGGSESSNRIKSMPLGFEATIDFDLDINNQHMLKAAAESKGSFSLNLKGLDQPYIEDRFKGRTIVKLENRVMVGATKPVVKKGGG